MEQKFITIDEFWKRAIDEGHCTEKQVKWWLLRARILVRLTSPFYKLRYILSGLFCCHEFELFDQEDGCETPWLCVCIKCGKMYRGKIG